MAAHPIQWGTITLHLDNETFRTSFSCGRRMYFDESEYEFPERASRMTTLEAVGSVLDEDGKGGYCFDRMAFKDPIDVLGFFLGYMSGPVLPESSQEHDERMARIIILPEEPASTTASTL